jgi:hypothetical protein
MKPIDEHAKSYTGSEVIFIMITFIIAAGIIILGLCLPLKF